ncbi:MAG TPA: hypothetical protein DCY97_13380, partial [Marinilabiliales bacterium]|nr:hypothetical protein [Marinilabiliales bacterium]
KQANFLNNNQLAWFIKLKCLNCSIKKSIITPHTFQYCLISKFNSQHHLQPSKMERWRGIN